MDYNFLPRAVQYGLTLKVTKLTQFLVVGSEHLPGPKNTCQQFMAVKRRELLHGLKVQICRNGICRI